MAKKPASPVIANRKAYHDYLISEELEAGIVLLGCEVKVIRQGGFTLRDAYCELRDYELWLVGAHIPEYAQASTHVTLDPIRKRKLLVSRAELKRLRRQIIEKGATIVPLKAYFKGRNVKVMIGVAKGKRQYDKRETIKKRDVERDEQRRMK